MKNGPFLVNKYTGFSKPTNNFPTFFHILISSSVIKRGFNSIPREEPDRVSYNPPTITFSVATPVRCILISCCDNFFYNCPFFFFFLFSNFVAKLILISVVSLTGLNNFCLSHLHLFKSIHNSIIFLNTT